MSTTTHTLSNGIVIHDHRAIQCGVRLENNEGKYISLYYTSKNGGLFALDITAWVLEYQVDEFQKELSQMTQAMKDANELIKNTNK